MNQNVKLQVVNGEASIIDKDGNIIVSEIHDADEVTPIDSDTIIRFYTKDNEYSYITSSGLYLDKYSYKDYDLVCELIPNPSIPIYKIRKNNKYGIACYSKDKVLDCIFDEIEFLKSNLFTNNDIIRLRKNGKYSLIHGAHIFDRYKEYDYIYTPIQPLERYIVCKNGKYGFIETETLKEIVEPTFDTIEELCFKYGYNIDKYTKDLYAIDKKIKLNRVSGVWDEYHSHYIDENHILKGEWGGADELLSDCRTEDVYVYQLYYSEKNKRLPINIYGYFYNLFSSQTYDIVIHGTEGFYIIIKDEKYGLIDDEYHILLEPIYENIHIVCFSLLGKMPLFVVTCEDGKQFLYNAELESKTRLYDSLSCYDLIPGLYKDYLVYEENGKFGIMSPEGDIIVKAKFDLYKIEFGEREYIERGHAYFQEIFHERKYSFYIDEKMFYGKIPMDKYEVCIRIGRRAHNCVYITKTKEKYGLLNQRCEEIIPPKFDDVILSGDSQKSIFYIDIASGQGKPISKRFLIGKIDNKYSLYYIESIIYSKHATLIISDCTEMKLIEEKRQIGYGYEFPYVQFEKDGIEGFVNEDGEIISIETFDEIKPIIVDNTNINHYLIYKSKKVGLLDSKRKVVIPCIYDDILRVKRAYATVIEDGKEKDINYKKSHIDDEFFDTWEDSYHHYSRYAGSYAQDEMGYSDEDIDTIFDGDPNAYWNID